MTRAILSTLAILLTPAVSYAAFEITGTPEGTSGNFEHNVFHTAHANGGSGGSIQVYFELNMSETSTYDPSTGALTLHVNLFTDEALSNAAGSAVGTSTDLLASHFNGHDGGILGSISWDFSDSSGFTDTIMTFFDKNYGVSSNGGAFVPNSLTGTVDSPTSMTLWGANGTANPDDTYSGQTQGVDLVMTFGAPLATVPAPPSLALALLGLASCPVLLRRRKTNPAA